MIAVQRFVARVVLVAMVCVLTTTWFGWASLPFVGFIYGLTDWRARARGTIAALGAALGWLAILGAAATRGADVRAVAERIGEVMQVPALAFIVITLVFAALLSGMAATLGAEMWRIRARRMVERGQLRASPTVGQEVPEDRDDREH